MLAVKPRPKPAKTAERVLAEEIAAEFGDIWGLCDGMFAWMNESEFARRIERHLKGRLK